MITLSGASNNRDIRIIKTHKALYDSLLSILNRRSFGSIRVGDLCEEAQISRATFYAHFDDKYDLLRNCLASMRPERKEVGSYELTFELLAPFVRKNEAVIKNLLTDLEPEVLDIVSEFVLSFLEIKLEKYCEDGKINPKYIVLTNMFGGGMISYLRWQVENKFPLQVPAINRYIYEIVVALQKYGSDSDCWGHYQ